MYWPSDFEKKFHLTADCKQTFFEVDLKKQNSFDETPWRMIVISETYKEAYNKPTNLLQLFDNSRGNTYISFYYQ